MAERCVAIKSGDGLKCTRKCVENHRCNMHHNTREYNGHNFTELNEHEYIYKNKRKVLKGIFKAELLALGPNPYIANPDVYFALMGNQAERERRLGVEQRNGSRTIKNRHLAEIERTGINPDAVQDARRLAEVRAREVAMREQEARWRQQRNERLNNHFRNGILVEEQNGIIRERPPVAIREGLAGFANDRQNIHTSLAVDNTIKSINEVLKIAVPEEYRWNMIKTSMTMSEIISECELSPSAAWQMVARYCSDESIYNFPGGIYGKVLDGVWQYIKASPDKNDLKKILKAEMQDNIGMCAQGNLSRLTNILSGYLDTIVIKESMTDQLGRLLPPLMEIEDLTERMYKAAEIFREVGLKEDEWKTWALALLDDDNYEMHIFMETITLIHVH